MHLPHAIDRVMLGEPLQMVAESLREELLVGCGLQPAEASPQTFRAEVTGFMNKLCRELAERHPGDTRVGAALQDWVRRVNDYDAFDALLTAFASFDGRDTIVRRGRTLFPGPLTAHWEDE